MLARQHNIERSDARPPATGLERPRRAPDEREPLGQAEELRACELRVSRASAGARCEEPVNSTGGESGGRAAIDERELTRRDPADMSPRAAPTRQTSGNGGGAEQEQEPGSQAEEEREELESRHEDKNQASGAGRPEAARAIETRLLVRRREAGALIGKRGANIKRLRQLFKESLFNIPDTGNGPERVVCIGARSLDQLEPILADLAQLFQEKQHSTWAHHPAPAPQAPRSPPAHSGPAAPATSHHHQQQHYPSQNLGAPSRAGATAAAASEFIEVKLLVNASHAGLLIGLGGQSIRKLRNDSKAAIKIYEMCCPLSSDRVCAIKAKPPVVVSTIRMIHELLAQTPIKGAHKPYDALNFDPNLADKYGGFAPDDDCRSFAAAAAATAPTSPNSSPAALASSPFSSSSMSPATPFELLHQQLQRQASDPTALMLHSHAVRLLAAAAAANAGDHFERAPAPRPSAGARFNRPASLAQFERRTEAAAASMMAALAAEKYHSFLRAGQQAVAASRFHPYLSLAAHQAHGQRHHDSHRQAQQLQAHQPPARHRCGGPAGARNSQPPAETACPCRSPRSPATSATGPSGHAPPPKGGQSASSSASSTSSTADSAGGK